MRPISSVAAAALVVLGAAGCSDSPPQPAAAEMTVSVCLPGDPDDPQAGVQVVEVRRDGEVLAGGTGSVGTTFDLPVPAGDVDVYLDDELFSTGSATAGSTLALPCPMPTPTPTPTTSPHRGGPTGA